MQKQFSAIATGAVTTRADASCGTTNGSAVVTDAAAVAGDVGKPVSGTGIPAGSSIISVAAGVSFTMNQTATATGSITATVGYVPVDAGAGKLYRNIYAKAASPAANSVVAIETSPDNTTYTEVARITGSNWVFARSDHQQRYLRANVVNLGTGGGRVSVNILASPV